mmetsp:Transcript_29965/g.49461  ORF Transcript_29965/g.49461 Transcript_29965/m.49461 type:complete len:194 (+) Transcript_29965:153-734(+)|eukprot:CAMPEP_0119014560 /NCGR_PEP_ID=MMETSP1176-20130426/9954_1 /TAXON_ID=265551 /ORGANISM="Synedropsis recta cf, Strain CCMP1620" /LENGTH=193 /DNA_ID=CAMNT_0006967761 /DNA_START=139 /DNA_END=720 /DNA_ORIENTATION=+
MASTLDELEEIERSARVGPAVGRVSPTPVVKGERRRGSSMFTGGDAMMDYKNASASPSPAVAPAPIKDTSRLETYPKRELNKAQPAPVKPPENVPRPAPPAKRGSVALKPLGLGGLVDFDDSDFDDSDEEDMHDLPGAPMPGSKEMVGGPNHRPLVGGFAAAAYEAARAHHYAQVDKDKPVVVPKRRGPPPSI